VKIGILARAVQKHYKKSHSWRLTGQAFGMNKALARKIALLGFEPHRPETRERLGLDPIRICPKCHHRIKKNLRLVPWHRLSDLKPDQVLWLLEHREVMS